MDNQVTKWPTVECASPVTVPLPLGAIPRAPSTRTRFTFLVVPVCGFFELDCPCALKQIRAFFVGKNASKRLNDLYEFSFESKLWSKVEATRDLPSPRFSHTAVLYNEAIHVFGGRKKDTWKPDDLLNDFFRFDLGTEVFKRCSVLDKDVRTLILLFMISVESAIYHSDAPVESSASGGWGAPQATRRPRYCCLW